MEAFVVKPLPPGDVSAAVSLLERAAVAEMDEAFRFFIPDRIQRRDFHYKLLSGGILEGVANDHVFAAYESDRMVGVCVWQFASRPSLKQRLRRRLRDWLRPPRSGEATVWRAYNQADRHRRIWPHWYLMLMGIEPACRNSGLGGQLLTPLLQQADRTNAAIYLTTLLPRNRPFYRRHGFVNVGDWRTSSSPVLTTMLRKPRGTVS